MNRAFRYAALVIALALLSACAPSHSIASESLNSPRAATGAVGSKVAVVIFENRDRARAEKEMPFLASLEKTYGSATNYHACGDPSLTNYVCIGFGKTYGITDDRSPKFHPIKDQSIMGAALAHGKTAHEYAESEQTNCSLVDQGTNAYVVHHNPWPYAVNERTSCQKNMTGWQPLAAAEANGMPDLSIIIPNNQHNGHRPSNDVIADNYLKSTIWPGLVNSPEFKDGTLTVVLTFDEGRGLATPAESNIIFVAANSTISHLSNSTLFDQTDLYRALIRKGGGASTGSDPLSVFGL